jgi:hypothetical protein
MGGSGSFVTAVIDAHVGACGLSSNQAPPRSALGSGSETKWRGKLHRAEVNTLAPSSSESACLLYSSKSVSCVTIDSSPTWLRQVQRKEPSTAQFSSLLTPPLLTLTPYRPSSISPTLIAHSPPKDTVRFDTGLSSSLISHSLFVFLELPKLLRLLISRTT